MSPAEFSEEMLRVVRRDFYPAAYEKEFFEDRRWLLKAITEPAKYLNDRGARVPASKYRAILSTVFGTIKRHGNSRAKIERFAVYLLHCVQKHLQHHGEEYYYAAKELRPVGSVVGSVLERARKAASVSAGDQTVPILAEVHRALTVRGRIQKTKKTARDMELPGLCNPVAKRPD